MDVADDEAVPGSRTPERLAAWRADIRRACDGAEPRFQVNRDSSLSFKPPVALRTFDELLKGVEMDLDISVTLIYAELEQYCYRVASVVGLLSIRDFWLS